MAVRERSVLIPINMRWADVFTLSSHYKLSTCYIDRREICKSSEHNLHWSMRCHDPWKARLCTHLVYVLVSFGVVCQPKVRLFFSSPRFALGSTAGRKKRPEYYTVSYLCDSPIQNSGEYLVWHFKQFMTIYAPVKCFHYVYYSKNVKKIYHRMPYAGFNFVCI